MYKIKIKTGQKHYPVYLGKGIMESVGSVVSRHLSARPVLIVCDKNVSALYAKKCLESLRREGFKPHLEILEGGERGKTLETVANLYTKALELGLDRHSAVIALGGGVTGDLAGFFAATYLRGLPFVQVPTTLLAMVDSSVGGKVAVNHPLGKNLIGAFHQPALVISDTHTLETLPPREFNAGWAELIKYGVVCSKKLFKRLESLNNNLSMRCLGKGFKVIGAHKLMNLIIRAVSIKGAIVCRDEKEENLRRVLNFGHTFGHALEAATHYGHYLHGEAVAGGMIMATELALRLKQIDEPSGWRIKALLENIERPSPPGGLTAEAVAGSLLYDKKRKGEELVFVLPCGLGKALFCSNPPFHLVEKVIGNYLPGKHSR